MKSKFELLTDRTYCALGACLVQVDILPVCEAEEVGILAYTPLMAGLLSGKYTDAAAVPEGRQRTKHFNHTRTDRCYHGGPGAEAETFRALANVQHVCDSNGISTCSGQCFGGND
jgi:myo-inositol catabolism protein IolS